MPQPHTPASDPSSVTPSRARVSCPIGTVKTVNGPANPKQDERLIRFKYNAGEITVEFLNDGRKGARSPIQEHPPSLHGFSVVPGCLMFAEGGDVPFWFVPQPVLYQRAELVGVREELPC